MCTHDAARHIRRAASSVQHVHTEYAAAVIGLPRLTEKAQEGSFHVELILLLLKAVSNTLI